MIRSHLVSLFMVVILIAGGFQPIPAFGAKDTPLIATFGPITPRPFENYNSNYPDSNSYGIFGDFLPDYAHGEPVGAPVSCYFGVNNGVAVLVTYNTSRTLRFRFDPNDVNFKKSGLLPGFETQVDIFGVNYFGHYYGGARRTMGINTIARVELNIQFYQNVGWQSVAFQLEYPNAAVIRYADGSPDGSWLITTNPEYGNDDFRPSADAMFSLIRRRKNLDYGIVSMPIEFRLQLKP